MLLLMVMMMNDQADQGVMVKSTSLKQTLWQKAGVSLRLKGDKHWKWLFATPWTVSRQAPLSTVFSRQECWRRWPFPSLGDLLNAGIESRSPALQADILPSEPPGSGGLPLLAISYKGHHAIFFLCLVKHLFSVTSHLFLSVCS